MFAFGRTKFNLTSLALLGALAAGAASLPAPARGQGTHLWTQSQLDEFEKGTPQGVALSSDGHLREAPDLDEVVTTPSTFVWSVAADKNGAAFLGTGSPATVLRVGPEKDAKPFTLFETKDVSVQSLRLGPDGALYAATLPSGKVYKLDPAAKTAQDDASATVVFDLAKADAASDGKGAADKANSKPRYIWDLTFDAQGRLYIATGDPGAVHRVDVSKPGAAPELFFKSDEAHIRSLAWDGKGNLIAGSDGSGLVYRINPEGKGYVLFEAPRREITAVAVAANGTIYAASVGDKTHNTLSPLPVTGQATITITVVQPNSVQQAANPSASVPEGTEIYALEENQAPRLLWSAKDEIVYALASQPDGLLALTGNRGRIFRIQDDGSYADVGHLDAQQGLSMARVKSDNGSDVLIGTGNTGKLFAFDQSRANFASRQHEYASDVLDCGAMARFGRVEIEPGSANYALFTRTGNVEQPIRGWSDWESLKDDTVASPPGRFLQWKAELKPGGVLGSVGVNYLPVNAAPVVDEIVVVPGARLNPQNQVNQPAIVNINLPSANQGVTFTADASTPLQAVKDRTAITVRWAAHDDNGDDMDYALYLRGDGETVWRLLKDKIDDKAYSFDATLIPDGGYQIKVVASNEPSEPPGQALTGEKISDRFIIDTTPPEMDNLKASIEQGSCGNATCPAQVHVTFDAVDSTSPIAHAEYSLDAGPWQYIDPVGEISDSKTERYDFKIPVTAPGAQQAEHLITVRAYDRYDNVGVAKTVVSARPAALGGPAQDK
jgi:sugar lactone lactonase YvrE